MTKKQPTHTHRPRKGIYIFFTILGVLVALFLFRSMNRNVLGTTTAAVIPENSNAVAVNTSIRVKTNTVVTLLPPRFLGFSFETAKLCDMVNSSNPNTLLQLFRNIGPQVIRVGGNTADYATWNPNGTSSCSATGTVLTQQLVDSFFSIAKQANAKALWTVNLGANDPDTYSQEAKYVVQKGNSLADGYGSFLWGLAIGNEPDLYIQQNLRPSTYNANTYVTEWGAYKNAIAQATNNTPYSLTGGDFVGNIYYNQLLAANANNLSLATHHYYAVRANGTGLQAGTIDNLLSSALMQDAVNTYINPWVAKAGNLPLAIDETNSAPGGIKGLSNTFASTLWGLDYMFTALEHGVKQMNFHSGGSPTGYSPIALSNGVWSARPLYYAFLVFRFAAPNSAIVSTTVNSPYNIVAHAAAENGNLKIVIINKDLTHAGTIQVDTDQAYKAAGIAYLTSPSVSATDGITFGGQAIQPDGSWSGKGQTIQLINNDKSVVVTVPAASAAVVMLNK